MNWCGLSERESSCLRARTWSWPTWTRIHRGGNKGAQHWLWDGKASGGQARLVIAAEVSGGGQLHEATRFRRLAKITSDPRLLTIPRHPAKAKNDVTPLSEGSFVIVILPHHRLVRRYGGA
jgi:hypothetical protein